MKGRIWPWAFFLPLCLGIWACDDGGGDGYSYDDAPSAQDHHYLSTAQCLSHVIISFVYGSLDKLILASGTILDRQPG